MISGKVIDILTFKTINNLTPYKCQDNNYVSEFYRKAYGEEQKYFKESKINNMPNPNIYNLGTYNVDKNIFLGNCVIQFEKLVSQIQPDLCPNLLLTKNQYICADSESIKNIKKNDLILIGAKGYGVYNHKNSSAYKDSTDLPDGAKLLYINPKVYSKVDSTKTVQDYKIEIESKKDIIFANTTDSNPVAKTSQPVTQSTTELKIEDIVVGTGKEVKSGDKVSINYKGTLLDGTEFDSSYKRNKAFETEIGSGKVIKGWDQGIIGLKEGGKRRLMIPANLGYGNQPQTNIPANSTLIFEVELLKIN